MMEAHFASLQGEGSFGQGPDSSYPPQHSPTVSFSDDPSLVPSTSISRIPTYRHLPNSSLCSAHNYTMSEKQDRSIFCNFKKYEPIFIIFGEQYPDNPTCKSIFAYTSNFTQTLHFQGNRNDVVSHITAMFVNMLFNKVLKGYIVYKLPKEFPSKRVGNSSLWRQINNLRLRFS